MQLSLRTRWRAVGRYVTLLLALALIVPLYSATPSYAEQDPPEDTNVPIVVKPTSKLSARLTLLSKPALQTADAATRARAIGLPSSGAGSLAVSAQGEVLTYIRVADTSAATLAALTANGARIVHVAPAYLTVTAYVRSERLRGIAGLAVVNNVYEELQPKIARAEPQRRPSSRSPHVAPRVGSCPVGLVSEGDTQLKAAQARSAAGVDGAGITLGVLSDSYNASLVAATTAETDVVTGDLPGNGNSCGFTTPVNVLEEIGDEQLPYASDEGRAMLQIVHDLAPASKLSFATALNGLFSFADNIRALQKAGANVIVDDISYFEEPFFQDGPVNAAIKDVTNNGGLYFTAAGNDNITDNAGNLIGSYEAVYRPKGCVRLANFGGEPMRPGIDCHNFDPRGQDSLQGVIVQPTGSFILSLQWSEPWYGVSSDFDVYLVDDQQHILTVGDSINNGVEGTQRPWELLSYYNFDTAPHKVNIVIARYKGTGTPRIKYTFINANHIEATEFNATNSTDTFGPTIYGHSAETSAFSVAAVPFNDATTPEDYTSRGPTTMYFGPVTDTTPAPRLARPDIRNKPDFAATDGARTTFFYSLSNDGYYRFYGTSAAAPHAAAISALLLQQGIKLNRAFEHARVAQFLMMTAATIPNGVRDNVGAGLIDAERAASMVAELPPLQPRVLLPLVQR